MNKIKLYLDDLYSDMMHDLMFGFALITTLYLIGLIWATVMFPEIQIKPHFGVTLV